MGTRATLSILGHDSVSTSGRARPFLRTKAWRNCGAGRAEKRSDRSGAAIRRRHRRRPAVATPQEAHSLSTLQVIPFINALRSVIVLFPQASIQVSHPKSTTYLALFEFDIPRNTYPPCYNVGAWGTGHKSQRLTCLRRSLTALVQRSTTPQQNEPKSSSVYTRVHPWPKITPAQNEPNPHAVRNPASTPYTNEGPPQDRR